MSEPKGGAPTSRFLIHAAGGDRPITDFLALAASDPDIALLKTIGPHDHPHTALVEITEAKARALAQHFHNSNNPLTIEPDQPLSLFD